jgi:hypothetical protein
VGRRPDAINFQTIPGPKCVWKAAIARALRPRLEGRFVTAALVLVARHFKETSEKSMEYCCKLSRVNHQTDVPSEYI